MSRGWLVLLPLLLLPATHSIGVLRQMHAAIAVLTAVVLAWVYSIASRSSSPRGIAVLGASDDRKGIGAWELSLLGFVAAVAVAYLVVGWRVHLFLYADAAYYYGVARHMALTGHFEEPIVWHFLHPPQTVVHAPFDYWGGMTTLLLVPPMLLFGATPTTAIVTMSVISGAVLAAFWYLVCVALPLRHCVAQLLAVVTFALSPAMDLYRFQPESITVAHLFLLAALIAFCRERAILAVLCGFCMLLTRGDGVIFFALLFLAVLLREWRGAGSQRRRPLRLIVVGFACITIYVVWSLASFGTLTPPGSQIVPFLPSYWNVYDFGVPHRLSWSTLLDHFAWHALVRRVRLAVDNLRALPIAPFLDAWLIVAVLSVVVLVRRRNAAPSLIWVLCFGGFLLVACLAGVGFAAARTPYTFTPLVILAGAFGVDAILDQLEARLQGGTWSRMTAAVIGTVVLAVCAVILSRIPVLQGVPILPQLPPGTFASPEQLSRLDDVLRGEPVATNLPWQMIAYTQSPAVSIPWNGEAAIDAVLARYQVGWMVLFGGLKDCTTDNNPSCPVFMRVLGSEQTNLGRFRTERVRVGEGLPAVFRVSINP